MTSIAEREPVATEIPTGIEIKRIPYRGHRDQGWGDNDGILDYIILPGNQCVYSGLTKPPANSTINAAENIIEKIAHREECELNELQFFDLETCLGYDSFEVESYDFINVVPKLDGHGELKDVGFNHHVECPSEVLQIFRAHIGTITAPNLSHAEALEQGFNAETHFHSKFATIEEAIAALRQYHNPKPETLYTFGIVDRATIPGVEATEDARYELRLRKPETVVREGRWAQKALVETRRKVQEYKTHRLSQEELVEVAALLQQELGYPQIPFGSQMEYLMRAILAILKKNPGAGYIWNKLHGGVEGLFLELCLKMPGFTEAARSDTDSVLARALIQKMRR